MVGIAGWRVGIGAGLEMHPVSAATASKLIGAENIWRMEEY
jgi:hypothetical protein